MKPANSPLNKRINNIASPASGRSPARDSPLRRRNEVKAPVEAPKEFQYPEFIQKMIGSSPGGFWFYFAISAALTFFFMFFGGFLLEFAFHFLTIIIIAVSIWAYRSI